MKTTVTTTVKVERSNGTSSEITRVDSFLSGDNPSFERGEVRACVKESGQRMIAYTIASGSDPL